MKTNLGVMNSVKNFRQLPQDVDAEQSIISAAMLGAAGEVLSFTSVDDLLPGGRQMILKAIFDLYSAGDEVNMTTVGNRLRDTGQLEAVGGYSGVSRLVEYISPAVSVEYSAGRVREKAVRRRIIQAANEIARAAYEEQDFEILQQQAGQAFRDVDRPTAGGCFTSYADLAQSEPERWEKIDGGLTGISSGYPKIDAILGGFQGTDLIILGARPGMGKSALMMNFAEHAARHDFPAAVFSLEMSKGQLYGRQTARTARMDSQKFRLGGIQPNEWQRIADAQQELHGLPIYLDDTPRLHVTEIKRRARYAIDRLGVKLIAIDYLQLIRGDNRQARKDLEIGDITGELKGLAKELCVPVLLLSQLNRGVEARENKRPKLADLRESGAIEQDADVIAFLYRDEYYNLNTDRPGIAEFDIAKHRNGPTGTVFLTWIGWRQSFENHQRYQ